MKKVIKLKESELKNIIKESVKKIISESFGVQGDVVLYNSMNGYDNSEYDLELEWEDCMKTLQDIDNASECVVIGNVGTWNGNHDIYPDRVIKLTDAVRKCLKNADDAIITQMSDGTIKVENSHHDGRNSFTIIGLNREGVSMLDAWEAEEIDEDINAILNNEEYRYKFN